MEMVKNETSEAVKLSLLDRIVLPSIFMGVEGNFKQVIIIRDLKKKVEPTQDEMMEFEIRVHPINKSVLWNTKGAEASFEYDFTPLEKNEIKLALEKMDKNNKLTEDYINLYQIFCETN